MQDSLFTKIIKGEIPCHKIYEDEKTLAFLDIFPVAEGHTLVIPKKQVEFVWDLEDEDYEALMNSVKKVALHLREASGKKHVGVKIVGVDVPHAHVQLIPFDDSSEMFRPQRKDEDPDHGELARVAERLRLS